MRMVTLLIDEDRPWEGIWARRVHPDGNVADDRDAIDISNMDSVLFLVGISEREGS